jgi:hypothetical protein
MGMYHNIIGLFIIFLFYQSCQVKSNLDQDTHEKLDQIVLIIDKCPDQNRYYHESTRVQSRSESDFDITYIDFMWRLFPGTPSLPAQSDKD